MIKYSRKSQGDFLEKITKAALLPASEHLFTVHDDNDPGKRYLDETKAMQFHHSTAHLLFMSQQACHNLQMVVSFLTTWVKKPDEDE